MFVLPFQAGGQKEKQSHGKSQVDGPYLGGIEHQEAGQGQLKQGPRNGYRAYQDIFMKAETADIAGLGLQYLFRKLLISRAQGLFNKLGIDIFC